MARSVWKGPYLSREVLKLYRKEIKKIIEANKKFIGTIKTWSRDCSIIPQFLHIKFLVHNGKGFVPLIIRENMVGHKLGEFVPTRSQKRVHAPDKKK